MCRSGHDDGRVASLILAFSDQESDSLHILHDVELLLVEVSAVVCVDL